jgi:phage FluMu gp28-like protein
MSNGEGRMNMAKGKAPMAKRKRSKSSTPRSSGLPITGSESPDQPITASESSEQPATGLLDGEPLTPLASLQALAKDSIPVLPYQDRWIMDDSQLKVAVWSRQSGKSFAAALRAVLKCMGSRTQYIILSKGERQSRMFMEKVKDFCVFFKRLKALPAFNELETDDKTMEIYFPKNRSRIIGLPANPDTARGYSGHIVLDEFAFHGDAHKIYAACFPIITRGYSIEVISTPNGTAGKFYEIAKAAGLVGSPIADKPSPDCAEQSSAKGDAELCSAQSGLWSGHRVDIYDAVAQGLPADINLLRSGCDDEETWLQEYGCQFLSDAQNYIPVELISTCVHEEATTEVPGYGTRDTEHGEGPSRGARDLYMGVDIGRKRDLTIAWLFEKVGGVLWSRRLLVMKGMNFDQQEKEICRLIDGGAAPCPVSRVPCPVVRRCCVDQSGIGMMLAEHLVQRYGAMVEPVTFTAPLKERLAPLVKMAFEERTVRIPDNREVRADINSVKRFVTLAGNVRFDAEHTDRGHADRFWALAMVVNAASEPSSHFDEIAGLVGSPVTAGFARMVL